MNDLQSHSPLVLSLEARCDEQVAREACRQARDFLAGTRLEVGQVLGGPAGPATHP